MNDLLKLFEAVVTTTALYGSCSWVMTRERKLQVAQRRMLRRVCSSARRPDEDWVDWIRRATDYAEHCLKAHGADSWVVAQRSRKWRWAGKVARMMPDRWAQLVLLWEPGGGHRRVGRPCRRWSEDLEEFCNDKDWILYAQDDKAWQSCEASFKLS